MQVAFFLYRHGNQWIFDLSPLAGSNATPNVLRALAKVAQRLGSLNVMGDIKMFAGNELDQVTGYWLQQTASGLETLARSGGLNSLTQQVKVKSIRFHALHASHESIFQVCVQELAAVLGQPIAQRTTSSPELKAQRPPSHPQQPITQKPNSQPQQGGARMSNQNIPLVDEDSGHRQIFYYYVFNTNTDEIVKEGSVIVPGRNEEEGKKNITERIKSTFLGVPLTSDLQLHVRWVTSFEKKREDPNAKLVEALKMVLGAGK